jgi:hypothetical protein
MFTEIWLASFTENNWVNAGWSGWIDIKGNILSDWFLSCGEFCWDIARFKSKDFNEWLMRSDWKILIKKIDHLTTYRNKFYTFQKNWRLRNLNWEIKNWYALFFKIKLKWKDKKPKWWWMKDENNVIEDKGGYNKCYHFDEEIKWLAKFEKDWKIWYVDTKWRVWDASEDRNGSTYVKKDWKWFNGDLIKL